VSTEPQPSSAGVRASIDPDGFRPLPIVDERAAAARAQAEEILARAESKARRTVSDAEVEAERILADGESRSVRALADANRIREQAKTEQAERLRRDDNLDTWAARAIIAGTVGLTASGEYALARMVGFDAKVAWLLPFVIDVYVIQAFRRHRDIIQAITLTIAANVAYHLADARMFGLTPNARPTWWLIAMVASVASLILWRVHLMTAPPKPPRERRRQRQNESHQAPAPSTTPAATQSPAGDSDPAKTAANADRQKAPTGAASNRQNEPAKKAAPAAKKPTPATRQSSAKKAASKRRSMDDWATDAGPVFHAEFIRLRRNPTATEFAAAIQTAGLGKVSDSTAKNIRAEILDRTPLPELDETD
jgi:hypothetical protein